MNENILRELLADLCHRQWASWMDYLFSKGIFNENGTWTLRVELVERWQRQAKTDYINLSKDEKNSDRNEADKFLELLKDRLLYGQSVNAIMVKMIELKQSDGEGYAIGNFIQEVLQDD